MIKTTIKALKQGEVFTLKPYGDNPNEARVYVRGGYDRSDRKYYAYKWNDTNRETGFKPSREVYTDFIF